MDVLTVAEEKKPKKSRSEEFTTLRIYAADGEDLSDLAQMENKTIAEMYKELCADLIRKRRIQRTEEKLKRLKQN